MNDLVMPPSAAPHISVVVATYQRASTLAKTLRCLAMQGLPRHAYEVIVVDDGSSDSTPDVVQAAQDSEAMELRYLQHPNRGPGYTQNRGIRDARAPIVLLIADDIFLCPGALKAHLDYHDLDPDPTLAVLGLVLQSDELDETVFLQKWNPFQLEGFVDRQALPYHMFWACNISFKREFMLRYGMFRDEMGVAGAAAHEDVELGYRLHLHGLRIHFGRDALGHHHHIETLDGTLRRSYQRGLNFPDFRRLVPHPEIDVKYRDYGLTTLLRSAAELSGPRQDYLMEGDRNLLNLGLRHLVRVFLFNRWSVRWLWLPFFDLAERHAWLAALVKENFYRGTVVYQFRRGCRDARRSAARSEVT